MLSELKIIRNSLFLSVGFFVATSYVVYLYKTFISIHIKQNTIRTDSSSESGRHIMQPNCVSTKRVNAHARKSRLQTQPVFSGNFCETFVGAVRERYYPLHVQYD